MPKRISNKYFTSNIQSAELFLMSFFSEVEEKQCLHNVHNTLSYNDVTHV